jgi:hypothetical protein
MIKKVLFPILVFGLTASAFGQDNIEIALKVADTQSENYENLKNYSWKRSVTMFHNGEQKSKRMLQLRYNSKGEIETIVLGEESNVKKQKGPLRKSKQQGAIEQDVNLVNKSLAMVFEYLYMSKGQLVDLYDKNTVEEKGQTYEINAEDVIQKGDRVKYILNKETLLFESVDINSSVDGQAIKCTMKFKNQSDGTNHPSISELEIPERGIVINTESFDFVKQ